MTSFESFVSWAFYGLISGLLFYAAKNLSELNNKVSSIKEILAKHETKHSHHELEIKRVDHRVARLEERYVRQ